MQQTLLIHGAATRLVDAGLFVRFGAHSVTLIMTNGGNSSNPQAVLLRSGINVMTSIASGAVVCGAGRLGAFTSGNVSIGAGTVVHPTARIIASVWSNRPWLMTFVVSISVHVLSITR